MRINKFLALATGMSRRAADSELAKGTVRVNGLPAALGQQVTATDVIAHNGRQLSINTHTTTILLNKPVGYVVSRNGQGSRTIYDLLPPKHHALKSIGRLDKDSSGLLLLTNAGQLAHTLTHPSSHKQKIYEITIDKPLQPLHRQMISDHGVRLDDGISKFELERLHEGDDRQWRVTMHEGRNRQIRRTFAALGYTVTKLHRTAFGQFILSDLPSGSYSEPADR